MSEHFPWCAHVQNMARPRSMQLIGPKCNCEEERRASEDFEQWLDSEEGQAAIDAAMEKKDG